MLPRNGFFQNIQCPYNKANLCHRPYCHFRHSPLEFAEEKKSGVSSSYLFDKDSSSNSRNQPQISNFSTLLDEKDSGYVPTPVIKCKPAGILKANNLYSERVHSVPEYKPTPISKLRELNIPTGPDYTNYPSEYPGTVRKKKHIEEYDPTEIKCIPRKSVSFADETEGGLLTCESAFSSDDDFDDATDAPKFSDDDCEENDASNRPLPPPPQPNPVSVNPLQKVESEESDIDEKKVDEFSLVDKILIETKRNEKLLKFHKKDTVVTKPVPQPTKPPLILKGVDPKKIISQNNNKLNNNDVYNMDDDSQNSVPHYSAFDSLVPPIEIDSLIKSKYDKKTFDSEMASYSSPTQGETENNVPAETPKSKDTSDKKPASKSAEQNLKPKKSDSKPKEDSIKCDSKSKDKKKESSKKHSSSSEKKHSKSDDKIDKSSNRDDSKKALKDSSKDSKSSKKSDSKVSDSSKRTHDSKKPTKDNHKNKDSSKKSDETAKDSQRKEKHKIKESEKKSSEKIKLKISLNSNNEKSVSKDKTKGKMKQTDASDRDICSVSSSSEAELQDGKVSSSSVEKRNKSSGNIKSSKSLNAPHDSKSKHSEDSKLSKKPFKRKEFSDSESEKTHSKNQQTLKKSKPSVAHADSSDDNSSSDERIKHKSKQQVNMKNLRGEKVEVIISSSDEDSDITITKSSVPKKSKHKNSPSSQKKSSIDEDIVISSDSDCDPNEECWKIYNETFNENSNEATTSQKEEPSSKESVVRDAQNLQKKRLAHAAAATVKKPKFSSNIRPVINPGQAMHNRYAQMMKMREENNELKVKIQAQPLISGGRTGIRIAVSPNSSLLAAINEKKKNSVSDFMPLPSTVSKTLKPTKRIAHVPDLVAKPRPIIPADYGSKVPTNIRQKFLNTFIDEFLKFIPNEEEAYEEALEEEKKAFQRSSSKAIYMNVASNTLARLRHRTAEASETKKTNDVSSTTNKSNKKSVSHQSVLNGPMAQRTSFSIEKKKPPPVPDLKGTALYEYLLTFAMSGDQLRENGFPMAHPTEAGRAVIEGIYASKARYCNDQFKRTCIRCQKVYYVNVDGDYVRDEECDFHWGRLWKRRIAGAFESRYNCCQGDAESDGCCVSPGHVFDGSENHVLRGYVKTLPKTPPPDKYYGIYALDCEMCYTTAGMELTRVTVVGPDLKPVYETFVKPLNQVLDYNTRFSGITEENLKNVRTTLRDVQAVLLCIFNSRTILIGHSLESDFKALKLIHPTVVDTSVVFPHKMGLPYKRALKTLMGEKLNKIIQNDVGGHDSQEDAVACMELMLWKVKEDLKNNR